MKKILFLMLFLTSNIFAQLWDTPFNTTTNYRSSSMVIWDPISQKYYNPSISVIGGAAILNVSGVTITASSDTSTIFDNGLKIVTTSATALGSGATKTVTITNDTPGSIIRYGGPSLTILNGTVLNYLDSFTTTVRNLNWIYVITPTAGNITYTYEN